jgi:hypothetical protein
MAVVIAAAAAVLVGACTNPPAPKVPSDYLQLSFASPGQPITTARITVGTKIAVQAISGHQDPPGYPISADPSIVRAIHWGTTTPPAPLGWYPFQAVSIGRAEIREGYPCSGTECAAMVAQIVVTVVPANA